MRIASTLLSLSSLPIGLSMALAENLEAMQRFSNMGAEQQAAFVASARAVSSKAGMHALVNSLVRP